MTKPPRNLGASVRARLLTLARDKNQSFELLLTRFVHERFLYRLCQTPHRDHFVLKGARLLTAWLDDPHRPTRDLDLLGFGTPTPDTVLAAFRDIYAFAMDDAVLFDEETLRVDRIRDELAYGGLRLRSMARVDGARVHVIIDVGFGDDVEPGLQEIELPVLLDMPAPRLRAYPPEAVVAEKFEALVLRGLANTRLKDFYDLWMLSRTHTFAEERLARAIRATFRRRGTTVPETVPDGLTRRFVEVPGKRWQWEAFVRDVSVNPGTLEEVTADLAAFLMPHAERARSEQQGEGER